MTEHSLRARRAASCVALALMTTFGCAGAPKTGPVALWPVADVVPNATPGDLSAGAQASVLRAGPDGFVHLVGGLAPGSKPGDVFAARYKGVWPFEDAPRPAQAAGQILRVLDDGTALVDLFYVMPGVAIESLEVTWDYDPVSEPVGKGFGAVRVEDGLPAGHVRIPVLDARGDATAGNLFALVRRDPEDASIGALQSTRRLVGVCEVVSTGADSTACQVLSHDARPEGMRPVKSGDLAILLTHSFGAPPRRVLFQVAAFEGDPKGEMRDAFVSKLEAHIAAQPDPDIRVSTLDMTLGPSSAEFQHVRAEIPRDDDVQIVVSGAVRRVDGEDHLVFNTISPDFPLAGGITVVSPPRRGLDMGPVDALDASRWADAMGMLHGAALSHRGQLARTMWRARTALDSPTLNGLMRRMTRVQLALLWSEFGRDREALWLTLEDERTATRTGYDETLSSALQMAAYLYGELELHERAVATSTRHLDAFAGSNPDPLLNVSVRGGHAVVLIQAGEVDAAKAVVDELIALCTTQACHDDIHFALQRVFSTLPNEERALRAELLPKMLTLIEADPNGALGLATLRLYQAQDALSTGDFTRAIELARASERLFGELDGLLGIGYAKSTIFMAQIYAGDPLGAHATAKEVLALAHGIGNDSLVRRTYSFFTDLIVMIDKVDDMNDHLDLAHEALFANFNAHQAIGDVAETARISHLIGMFYLRVGHPDAEAVFAQALQRAYSTARFDTAALSHAGRALIARARGDAEGFRTERDRALLMAKYSPDPDSASYVARLLSPPSEPEDQPAPPSF